MPGGFGSGFSSGFGGPTTAPPGLPIASSLLADALAGVSGPVQQSITFEWQSVDGAFVADLTAAIEEASIELDNNRAVVRTADLVINAAEMPVGFDPAADFIAIAARITVPVYQPGTASAPPTYVPVTTVIPMGLFHLEEPRRRFEPNAQEQWIVSASDLGSLLITSKTATPFTIAAGTNYLDAVAAVLTLLGLRSSFPVTVADVTPVAFSWAPGTAYGEIVNALLQGINWYPIWPDGVGVFTSRERIDMALEPAVVFYSTEAEPRLVVSPFEKTVDASRWHNRIAVVIDDPRRPAEYALRINNDPDSPISVAALTQPGKLPVVNSDEAISGGRVVDLATADEIAQAELRDQNARAQPSTLSTFADPRRGPREFYAVTVETEEVATIWRVEGWRLDLKAGELMQHRLGRAQQIDLSLIVALGGTALTGTRAQIVAGGRTILLTLPASASWVAAGALFDAERAGILAGLVSFGMEANGWNNQVAPALTVGNVVRTSAQLVTITLPAVPGYLITEPETVGETVPPSAIVGALPNYTEPSFTIIP